ncbi:metalloregulator ArsR/SmtB family transcription factor [uncultured Jannaschia sp.]|uniref:ArsR/SmtB family transcription factor n=1 Tax=uncultured Jannaschia sp. TaxID=293347 RepID=UPI00260248AD|nr:metalloregulator ArsR/SmtB family transcription factor [uncultured Jannaschia sp.]
MDPHAILTALADPTRRAVLDRLRGGALSVGRIAETLPVSRPAVSQHLRVLLDAGLVSVEPSGTRNLYALRPGGAGALVDWLGRLSETRAPDALAPGLRRAVTTRLTPGEARHLFCEDIARWWPVAQVSLSAHDGALPQSVVMEGAAGGALRELRHDGADAVWATIVERGAAWLALDWTLGRAEASRVTVAFSKAQGGSRVEIADACETDAARAMWDLVVERFAAAAASSLSNF